MWATHGLWRPRWRAVWLSVLLAITRFNIASAQDVFSVAEPAPVRTGNWTSDEFSTEEDRRAALLSYLTGDDVPPAPAAEGETPMPTTNGQTANGQATNGHDPSQVAMGRTAFENYCLDCHDAERSLQKRKTYNDWLATVRRMAAKSDASIPANNHVPIATYLASVAGAAGDSNGQALDLRGLGSLQPNATFATLWRGTAADDLTSPGFFVDAWIGADWQTDGPLSATVMTCTSCHSDGSEGQAFSLEFVEASATLDLKKAWKACRGDTCPDYSNWSLKLKGGRFIVPFGAFAGMVHPGSLRTVANPLMFDMARRFGSFRYLPVLPAPYTDEGFDLNFATEFGEGFRATADAFIVNGLQGDINISMANSRGYRDNNREPLTGARFTVGNQSVRVGTSYMGGSMQDDGNTPVWAEFYGADLTAQCGDAARFYCEYALRSNGQTLPIFGDNICYGVVCEAEVRVLRNPRISVITRYDNLIQKGYLFFPDTAVDRFTWGLNTTLPGGSILMLNHEHWVFSGDRENADVIALKWAASF
jgi:hypothetical protein